MSFYGIPIEKKYPLNNEDEVRIAIGNFNKCPIIKRKILANNINKRLIDFDMMVSLYDDNEFINYIDKRYLADVSNNEIRACYSNTCFDITQIQHSTKTSDEYNKDVYDTMVKFAEETNDMEKLTDFLREGNDYADSITRSMKTSEPESLMIMDIIKHTYDSLYLVSLQYNVSTEYVNKLLTDLEEMYLELQNDSYMVKRKIFALNQYNSRCITMKTELNILIGKKTKDLLNNKFTMKTLGKMSSFAMRYGQGSDTLTSYFKDKQNELKEYFTMQNKYFFSGFSFHKPLTGYNGDSFSMFEAEMDLRHRGRDIKDLLKRYPKLTLEIPYSDMYRLQKKFNYIKQISVEGLSNVTIVSINEGDIHFVTKKKNGDKNVFYLISYDKLLNMVFAISDGSNNSERWTKFTAMKVILKSEELKDENYNATLESCTKF